MTCERRTLARRGERDAVRFLKKSGYRILAKNYTCPMGELDIVASRDKVLSFVEVKTKSGTSQHPEEAVGPSKQRKLASVADFFIHTMRLDHLCCQFDVVAVNYDDRGRAHINHFPDAFEHPGSAGRRV